MDGPKVAACRLDQAINVSSPLRMQEGNDINVASRCQIPMF
jgi:hypothetical protein